MARRLVGRVAIAILLSGTAASPVLAQSPNGAALFSSACATCHSGAADSRAPALAALQARTPESILEVLVTGAMRVQGSRLGGAERRAIAEFISGKTIAGEVGGASTRPLRQRISGCVRSQRRAMGRVEHDLLEHPLPAGGPGEITGRGRAAPDAEMGVRLPRRDRPRGRSRRRGRTRVRRQPERHRLRARREDRLHPLDVQRRRRRPHGAVRRSGDRGRYASSTSATAAQRLRARRADRRQSGRARSTTTRSRAITGSPTLHDGRLYVPCRRARKSRAPTRSTRAARSAAASSRSTRKTGAVVWKTYMITAPPARRGKSTTGVPLWGPSGAAIWSAPTIDA